MNGSCCQLHGTCKQIKVSTYDTLFWLPGNEIQRKWKNIRDNFRREVQMQKKAASGQGATKRRKYIYFDQLLSFLPTMQGRSTSGNFAPPPAANEGDEKEVMTEHEVGEVPNAKAATYRQQKKRRKRTYEESFLEIIKENNRDYIDEDKSFLISLVPAFRKLDDEQKFVAKVEFLNVMRRITFCQPPHHVSSPPQLQSYSNLPGPHSSNIGTLPKVRIPYGTHHNFCKDLQHPHYESMQNPYSNFTPSPQQSTSTGISTPHAHMSPSDGNTSSPVTDSVLLEPH
jgi:hypothetical protein